MSHPNRRLAAAPRLFRALRRRLILPVLILIAAWINLSPAASQAQSTTTIWLPLLGKPAPTPAPVTNPTHQGFATYYDAKGDGSCMFDPSPNDLMVSAMNEAEFNNSWYCGSYVHVFGPKGEVTVRITDMCAGCPAGHLDLSEQAFAKIGDLPEGWVYIRWQLVSPPLAGPIAYHFMEESSQWWTAVQIRNHRNPVVKLEVAGANGQWINILRTDYNYFIQTEPGMGVGPFTFRVTDAYGNVLVDHGIPLIAGGTVSGAAQFPPGP